MKQKLLSGVKPTGRPHLGNYFGAMKQFVDLQNQYESYIFIADLHALTTLKNPAELRENIVNQYFDYLAIGLNPKKTKIFKQSDIPEVTELAWIFSCITSVPYLMRAHAFKDAENKNKEINAGVFNYPVLMAADILISDANLVPVGKDQKQHIEIARDIASKFNQTYGETFAEPKELILESVETVPGTDGQKMSKSYNNTIGLFAEDDEIIKAVMSIPTDSALVSDSKNPDESILYKIHSLVLDDASKIELRNKFINGGLGYKEAKENLIKDLILFIKPLRDRRNELLKSKNKLIKQLEKNGKIMKKIVHKKMLDVRAKVGISI